MNYYNGKTAIEKNLINGIRGLFVGTPSQNTVNYDMVKCGRNVHTSLKGLSKDCILLNFFKSSNDEQALNKYLNMITEDVKEGADIKDALSVFKYKGNSQLLENFLVLHLTLIKATAHLEAIEDQISDEEYEKKCKGHDVLEEELREAEIKLYRNLLDANEISPIEVFHDKLDLIKEII